MFDNIDLTSIQDKSTRELVGRLLNLVEKLSADLRDAQAEISGDNTVFSFDIEKLAYVSNPANGPLPTQQGKKVLLYYMG